MAEITTMIVNGVAKYKTTSAFDTCVSFQTPEVFAAFPRPRVLNTHLPPDYMPKQILEKRCKVLWMLRNPKDRITSGFGHSKKLYGSEAPPLEDMLYAEMSGQCKIWLLFFNLSIFCNYVYMICGLAFFIWLCLELIVIFCKTIFL